MNQAETEEAGGEEQPQSYDFYIVDVFTTSDQQPGQSVAVVMRYPDETLPFTPSSQRHIASQLQVPTTVFVDAKHNEPNKNANVVRNIDIVSTNNPPPPLTGHAAAAAAHVLIRVLKWTTSSKLGTVAGHLRIRAGLPLPGEPEGHTRVTIPLQAPHGPHRHQRSLAVGREEPSPFSYGAGIVPKGPSWLNRHDDIAELELTGALVTMYGHTTFLLVRVPDTRRLERAADGGQGLIFVNGVLDDEQRERGLSDTIMPYYYTLSAEAGPTTDPAEPRRFSVSSLMLPPLLDEPAAADAACAMAWHVARLQGEDGVSRFAISHRNTTGDRPYEMAVRVSTLWAALPLGPPNYHVYEIILEAPAVVTKQGRKTLTDVGSAVWKGF